MVLRSFTAPPTRILAGVLLAISPLLCRPVLAQEPPTFSGQWTATVGESRTFRGRWIGQAIPGQPEAAHGSWTLTHETGRTILRGTWAAQKSALGWHGTWRATDEVGRLFSGAWKADLERPLPGTFATLLELTAQKELSGSWRSGSLRGFWWLRGAAPRPVEPPPGTGKPAKVDASNPR